MEPYETSSMLIFGELIGPDRQSTWLIGCPARVQARPPPVTNVRLHKLLAGHSLGVQGALVAWLLAPFAFLPSRAFPLDGVARGPDAPLSQEGKG